MLAIAWALPCSLLGGAFGLLVLALGGTCRREARSLEFVRFAGAAPASTPWQRLPFVAITLGHVVIAVNQSAMQRLRQHEQVHVRQYERWGVLFFLAYPLASLWAGLRGQCPYRRNHFEVEAYRPAHPDHDNV
jgi:hypothetical protein